jgi:hypothetical protein
VNATIISGSKLDDCSFVLHFGQIKDRPNNSSGIDMDPLQLGHVDLRVMSRPLRESPGWRIVFASRFTTGYRAQL